jgi:hypothetical protein
LVHKSLDDDIGPATPARQHRNAAPLPPRHDEIAAAAPPRRPT